MNPSESNFAAWLRTLAAEPSNDTTDPWPDIRRGLSSSQRRQFVGVLKSPVRALATGVAAALVVGVGVGVALFANQAQTATAAEALQTLQVEAVTSKPSPGICGPIGTNLRTGGGVIAIDGGAEPGAPGAITAGGDPGAPVTASAADASQLSDKLAQALGVSGDRVRQAMRQTLSAELPSSPPPDPIAGIAQQLGVSTEQVCAAFSNPRGLGVMVSTSSPNVQRVASGGGGPSTFLMINGTTINLDSETTDQLSGPAQKLGVTPVRLLAAIKASAPPLPSPPAGFDNPNNLIDRFAQNLGMSPEKVRAAITQVEGGNHFYFVVPLPGFGQS